MSSQNENPGTVAMDSASKPEIHTIRNESVPKEPSNVPEKTSNSDNTNKGSVPSTSISSAPGELNPPPLPLPYSIPGNHNDNNDNNPLSPPLPPLPDSTVSINGTNPSSNVPDKTGGTVIGRVSEGNYYPSLSFPSYPPPPSSYQGSPYHQPYQSSPYHYPYGGGSVPSGGNYYSPSNYGYNNHPYPHPSHSSSHPRGGYHRRHPYGGGGSSSSSYPYDSNTRSYPPPPLPPSHSYDNASSFSYPTTPSRSTSTVDPTVSSIENASSSSPVIPLAQSTTQQSSESSSSVPPVPPNVPPSSSSTASPTTVMSTENIPDNVASISNIVSTYPSNAQQGRRDGKYYRNTRSYNNPPNYNGSSYRYDRSNYGNRSEYSNDNYGSNQSSNQHYRDQRNTTYGNNNNHNNPYYGNTNRNKYYPKGSFPSSSTTAATEYNNPNNPSSGMFSPPVPGSYNTVPLPSTATLPGTPSSIPPNVMGKFPYSPVPMMMSPVPSEYGNGTYPPYNPMMMMMAPGGGGYFLYKPADETHAPAVPPSTSNEPNTTGTTTNTETEGTQSSTNASSTTVPGMNLASTGSASSSSSSSSTVASSSSASLPSTVTYPAVPLFSPTHGGYVIPTSMNSGQPAYVFSPVNYMPTNTSGSTTGNNLPPVPVPMPYPMMMNPYTMMNYNSPAPPVTMVPYNNSSVSTGGGYDANNGNPSNPSNYPVRNINFTTNPPTAGFFSPEPSTLPSSVTYPSSTAHPPSSPGHTLPSTHPTSPGGLRTETESMNNSYNILTTTPSKTVPTPTPTPAPGYATVVTVDERDQFIRLITDYYLTYNNYTIQHYVTILYKILHQIRTDEGFRYDITEGYRHYVSTIPSSFIQNVIKTVPLSIHHEYNENNYVTYLLNKFQHFVADLLHPNTTDIGVFIQHYFKVTVSAVPSSPTTVSSPFTVVTNSSSSSTTGPASGMTMTITNSSTLFTDNEDKGPPRVVEEHTSQRYGNRTSGNNSSASTVTTVPSYKDAITGGRGTGTGTGNTALNTNIDNPASGTVTTAQQHGNRSYNRDYASGGNGDKGYKGRGSTNRR